MASSPTSTATELVYPFSEPPDAGQSLQVAPGVLWLRMPLFLQLNHINLWALEDGDGWTVVDTGMHNSAALDIWSSWLAGPLAGRPVKRVLVTHMHPDHIGMAGWLTRQFDCHLWITQLEYLMCRTLVADTHRDAPDDALRFYRQAGWEEAAIEQYQKRFGNFGRMIDRLPDSYHRLMDGDTLTIGSNTWQVVVGQGHSPEHACLYCADLKLFISGDQVIPRISSNVSVHPTEPDADPLAGWMSSIDKLLALIPSDVLVLPSHNEPFHGLHHRLNRLKSSQLTALDRLRQTLARPCRAVDVFSALFSRPISSEDGVLYGLATGEAIAHLNYLVHAQEVSVRADGSGVRWYSLA